MLVIHTHAHTHAFTHTYMYMYTHMHTRTHTRTHVHSNARAHTHTHTGLTNSFIDGKPVQVTDRYRLKKAAAPIERYVLTCSHYYVNAVKERENIIYMYVYM